MSVSTGADVDVDVDVVVLTWNDGPLLDEAVASALAQQELAVRVIVVDNGSEPRAVVVADERVTLIRSESNLGVGGGRNLGAGAGGAPFLCFLDSDARLHPHAISRLRAPMTAQPTIGIAAPVFSGQRPEHSAGRAPNALDKLRRGANLTDRYRTTPGQGQGASWDVDFAIGACQLVRRSAFVAVGGLDASAAFGPEDVDFCLRVRHTGFRVVQVADVGCDHPPRRAFRGILSDRGRRHAWAVLRYLWRSRRARQELAA
jgi:GT2 family glycosyltransferase